MTNIVVPGINTFPGTSLFPSPDLWPSSGTWLFTPPSVQRYVPVLPPVMALMNFGLAVLRINGQWVETEYPSEQQVTAADRYYEGGHIHMVGPDEAAELAAAGYTVEVVAPPVAPPSESPTAIVGSAVVGSAQVG